MANSNDGQGILIPVERPCHEKCSCEISKLQHSLFKNFRQGSSFQKASRPNFNVTESKMLVPT